MSAVGLPRMTMQPGKKLHDQIESAIRVYDRLLLLLSTDSMNSWWVKMEITKAREKEQRLGRQVLFPIDVVPFSEIRAWTLFDADLGQDLAKEIRSYHSRWKTDHDVYARGPVSTRCAQHSMLHPLVPAFMRAN